MNPKNRALGFVVAAVLCLGFAPLAAAEEIVVDGLAASEVGAFPKNWKTYPFHYGKAEKVYKVAEENGRKILRADDSQDISVPIFKDFAWDIAKYPYLKFRWRAQKIPAGSRETSPATNDSACAVYVGFGRTSALKYVWSASLGEGSYWAKNPGKFYIIAKQNGSGSVGRWTEETVSVKEDYQKYFGRPLEKKPSGIGVMTDGNATHQPAACDYADFRIATGP
ncbi:DUF3047 domain-containing protein [Deltaproteobacteria bacterium PRO3]|nr:DUF3047 domain-containing protein [Deltaproteobacteria bacterium PRO3]